MKDCQPSRHIAHGDWKAYISSANAVGCCWVYALKCDAAGNAICYKVCLIAKVSFTSAFARQRHRLSSLPLASALGVALGLMLETLEQICY